MPITTRKPKLPQLRVKRVPLRQRTKRLMSRRRLPRCGDHVAADTPAHLRPPPPAKKVRLDVSPVKRGGKKPPQDKVEVGNGRVGDNFIIPSIISLIGSHKCPRCQRQNINECRVPLTRDGITKSCRACNLVKSKCTFANGGAGKGAPRPIVNGEKREPAGPSTVGGTTPAPDAP